MAVLLRVFFCILLLYINADFFVIIYESIIYSVYILETHVSRDDNDNDIMKNLKESGNCFLLRLTRDTLFFIWRMQLSWFSLDRRFCRL